MISGLKASIVANAWPRFSQNCSNLNNILTTKDANGKITSFSYDLFNRLISVTTPKNETTIYAYYPGGQLFSSQDPKGNTISYTYDTNGNLKTKTDALGFVSQFIYDGNGNLVTEIDPNGNKKAYTYDSVNNLKVKTAPDNSYSFTYDFRKNITAAQNLYSNIGFTYDSNGKLVGNTNQGNGIAAALPNVTLAYTYDANGNKNSMTDAIGKTTYIHDSLDRMTGIQNPYGEIFGYAYNDTNGNLTQSRPGSSTAYAFDATRLIAGMTHSNSSSTLAAYQITRDLVGNITQSSSTGFIIPISHTISYDQDYQVASSSNSEALGGMQAETFGYDSKYNRTSDQGGSYTYDNKSERLNSDYRFNYFYDNNGNLIKKVSVTNLQDVVSYNYSSSNQLVSIKTFAAGSNNPVKEISYTYDVLGRRTQKVVLDHTAQNDLTKSFTRRYGYDGSQMLFEFDGSNNMLARYTASTLAPDDTLSVMITSNGTTAKLAQNSGSYQYLKDTSGSITDITDSTGKRLQHYIYSAFGILLGIQDASAADISSNPVLSTSIGFTGRELDSESGLMYHRAKYYDPTIGRFLQKDPAPGKIQNPRTLVNCYVYCTNNPWNYADPSGQGLFSGLISLLAGIATVVGAVFVTPLLAIGLAVVGAGLIAASLPLFQDAPLSTVANSFLTGAGGALAAIGGAVIGAAIASAFFTGAGAIAGGAFVGSAAASYGYAKANGASTGIALISALIGGFGAAAGSLNAPSLNPGDITPDVPLPGEGGIFYLPLMPNEIPAGQTIHQF